MARWLEQLEEYDFDVVYRRGELHVNADVLSRLTRTEDESNVSIDPIVPIVANTSFVPSCSSLDVRTEQLQDGLVGPFLRAKEKGDSVPSIGNGPKWRRMAQLWDQLFIKDGVLYCNFQVLDSSSSIMQLIVPDTLKEKVMYGVHEGIGGGHLGVEKSVAKLKEQFYWPGHYTDIRNWCANCSNCIARKTAPPHRRAPLQPVRVGYP